MRTSELGATTAGVWTRREALQVLTAGQVRSRLASGTWQTPWPGVYADAGHLLDPCQRTVAAVLAGGSSERAGPGGRRAVRSYACGRSAARVHGLLLVDDDDPATGAAEHLVDEVGGFTHGRSRQRPDGEAVLLRRQLVLRRGDVVRGPAGLWLTSLPRTLLDCAAQLPLTAMTCLLDDALHRGLATTQQLHDLLAERRGLPGVDRLRQAVLASDARAESPAETLARLLLLPALPGLVPQVPLHDETGRLLARFDLADERLRLAVETDGRRAHAGEVMLARDRRRDRSAQDRGWSVQRATWFDVRRRQAELLQRVVEAARRCRSVVPHVAVVSDACR